MRSSSRATRSRYRERVHPDRSEGEAAEHLERLLPFGHVREHPPDWLRDRTRRDAARYLTVADVAFPLLANEAGGWTAVTCLARGCPSEAARAHRARQKRAAARRPTPRPEGGVRAVIPGRQHPEAPSAL
jgi:hypothetical protein